MDDTLQRTRDIMAAVHNMHILATVDAEGAPHCRWMGAVVEDPAKPWTFYIACGRNSRKMGQIAANPKAQMVFSNQPKWEVATLSGTAVADDAAEPRQWLWEAIPMLKKYYGGPDDANMGIIKFTTKCIELLAMHENREPVCLELE